MGARRARTALRFGLGLARCPPVSVGFGRAAYLAPWALLTDDGLRVADSFGEKLGERACDRQADHLGQPHPLPGRVHFEEHVGAVWSSDDVEGAVT